MRRRPPFYRGEGGVLRGRKTGVFRLVRLGEHELIGLRRAIQRVHDFDVVRFGAVTRIDQQEHTLEAGPASQIIAHEFGPARDVGLRRLGVAVAGQIDEAHGLAKREEIQLARAPWFAGGAHEILAPEQRVHETRFADIRPARERHFRPIRGRQMVKARSATLESSGLAKEFFRDLAPAGAGQVQQVVDQARHALASASLPRSLSSNLSSSVSTPLRRMMMYCCAMESRLDHVQ